MKRFFICTTALALTGCVGKGFESKFPATGAAISSSVPVAPSYSPTNLTKALNSAARTLLQRNPTNAELEQASQGVSQYETVIRSYLNTPEFIASMRLYHNDLFEMSGQGTGDFEGINLNEPSNIILYIIQNNRDYREALTATYCVDDNLTQQSRCSTFESDTDAQAQGAGVLTTRGFLKKWVGPHNFRRVKKAFWAFACSEYPDGSDAGMTEDEIGNVAKGSTANFNSRTDSPVCFNCHSAINPRAALFLNFNRDGVYVPTPAGQMAPRNTMPTEVANRDATIEDVLRRPDGTVPVPRYHGQEVRKVRDYAMLFANGSEFKRCTGQRFFNYMLGRDHKTPLPPDLAYLDQIVESRNYNVKEIIVEIAKSMPYVNR